VLREFATRIRKSIRGIDLACRYGGEEFVIVMPETDLAVAGMVAERIRQARLHRRRSRSRRARKRLDVTISIGIATLTNKSEQASPACSSARTRRSIAPSVTAATAWCQQPPDGDLLERSQGRMAELRTCR
jgi:two-component system cell cycle response regulator